MSSAKIKTNSGHSKESALEKSTRLLKDNNLSITTARLQIMEILLREHGPFSVDEIIQKLPKKSCDQATVYRSLNQFVECGIVSASHLEKDHIHYEFNDPDHHHHHIICKMCKKIDSFHDCLLDKIEQSLMKKGYRDIQHRLEFFAVCVSCQK